MPWMLPFLTWRTVFRLYGEFRDLFLAHAGLDLLTGHDLYRPERILEEVSGVGSFIINF